MLPNYREQDRKRVKSRRDLLKALSLTCNAVVVLVGLGILWHGNRQVDALASHSVDEMPQTLQIERLINQVRSELDKTNRDRIAQHRPIAYKIKGFDLELTFALQNAGTKGSAFQYTLVTVNNQLQVTNQAIQKMTIHLDAAQPISGSSRAGHTLLKTGVPVLVSGGLNAKGNKSAAVVRGSIVSGISAAKNGGKH